MRIVAARSVALAAPRARCVPLTVTALVTCATMVTVSPFRQAQACSLSAVSRRLTVRRIVHALSALIIRRCQAMVLDQGIPFSPRSQSRRRRFARPRCIGKSWKKCCISPVEFGIFLPRLMNGTMVMLSWSILTIGLSSARWPHRRTTGKLRRHASG